MLITVIGTGPRCRLRANGVDYDVIATHHTTNRADVVAGQEDFHWWPVSGRAAVATVCAGSDCAPGGHQSRGAIFPVCQTTGQR